MERKDSTGPAAPPRVTVKAGDILDEQVDVLISTANTQLNMSGGVNGAILHRGGSGVQRELREHLAKLGRHWVEPGSVVRTGPGPLAVKHILHAVAINAFYESSVELVAATIAKALAACAELSARSAALPALATGYGPLSVKQFAEALSRALAGAPCGLAELRVVLAAEEEAQVVRGVLGGRAAGR
jgi:O-acetyl-ADP-ribose deacetylase (regulator of RNase III)